MIATKVTLCQEEKEFSRTYLSRPAFDVKQTPSEPRASPPHRHPFRRLDFHASHVYPELDRLAVFFFSVSSVEIRRGMRPSAWRAPKLYLLTFLMPLMFGLAACKGHDQSPAAMVPVKYAETSPDEPGKALPPDFDQALPVFPGAVVDHVRKPKGAMREILLETDKPIGDLIDFYRTNLRKNGFEVTSTLKLTARKTWSCDFHKGGEQSSILLFPSDHDNSHVTIDLMYEIPSRSNERPAEPEELFDIVGPGEVAQRNNPDQSEKRN